MGDLAHLQERGDKRGGVRGLHPAGGLFSCFFCRWDATVRRWPAPRGRLVGVPCRDHMCPGFRDKALHAHASRYQRAVRGAHHGACEACAGSLECVGHVNGAEMRRAAPLTRL